MRHTILIYLLLFCQLTALQSQALKKTHSFLIKKGVSIEQKQIKKPESFTPKLDSRGLFSSISPQYKSMPGQALNAYKNNLTVISTNEFGYPSRIKCAVPELMDSRTAGTYWESHLPTVLGLLPITGIGFTLKSDEKDPLGITHLKYDQTFDGTLVLDGEYFIHLYTDQSAMAHGMIYQPTEVILPKLNIDQAYSSAKAYLKQLGIQCIEPSLQQKSWIKTGLQGYKMGYWYNRDEEIWHLAFQLDVFPNAMKRWGVLVDAVSGKVLKAIQNQCLFHMNLECDHSKNNEPFSPQGSETTNAKDLFDITRTLNVWRESGNVYLLDGARPMFKLAQFKLDDPVGAIWTLNGLNSNPNNIQVDQIKTTNNTWSKTAVSAHYNAGIAFDYYANTHLRNSINGLGGTIISVINIIDENGGGLDNAFWNGEAMFYGNGAQAFNPLARGLDVAGHEMSHGVIQSTANLAYEGESGAINESFADVFGAMIDRNDWKIGEDVVKLASFPSGALRDMSDPHNGAQTGDFGRWQPRHVNEKYTGSQDNGGVHINSGIPNYAYYLFVQEMAKTSNEEQAKKTGEAVYYKALNQYLTRSSQFKDLRNAVEQACIDLHGNNSGVHNAAKKAFDQVGIGSSGTPGGGGGNYQKDLKVNPGKEFVVCTDDNFDGLYLINISTGGISQLSTNSVKSKPSVTDDGAEIYYVGFDSKLYGLFFNVSKGLYEEFVLDNDPIYRNASISKDGTLLAVLYEQEENKIHVYQFSTQVWKSFELNNPTTSGGLSTGNVRYADFMDFEPSGQNLMYDCLSELDGGASGTYEYWDIGFLRVWDLAGKKFGDGHIEKLFSDIPENTSIGNPVFSKNSPYIMAFDYLEEAIFGTEFSILGANIETGEVGEIASNRDDTGYPSFSVKDDVLLFNGVDNTNTVSLKFKALTKDKIHSSGSEQLFVSGAQWGSWFANGKRSLVKTDALLGIKALRVSPNPFIDQIHFSLESEQTQELQYNLYDIMGNAILGGTIKLVSGLNQVDIKARGLVDGIYTMQLISKTGHASVYLNKMGE